jgi:4-hydroxy-tetrahydrodipicolinate reductase
MTSLDPLSIGIIGANGKLGRSIIMQALADSALRIAGGLGSPDSLDLEKDLGELVGKESIGIDLSSDYDLLFEKSTLIIDVSLAANLENVLTYACKKKKPLVIGTTGHGEKNLSSMKEAAQIIPLFHAPNFSLGVAAATRAASLLSKMLGQACDISISETHHVNKKDRPSGTALHMALALCSASGREMPSIHSERMGDVIGEHRITFSLKEEQITLCHQAISRTLFAKGALRAAKFLAAQPNGFYSMDELLRDGESYATGKN